MKILLAKKAVIGKMVIFFGKKMVIFLGKKRFHF